jgi:PEGA domain-containing protein
MRSVVRTAALVSALSIGIAGAVAAQERAPEPQPTPKVAVPRSERIRPRPEGHPADGTSERQAQAVERARAAKPAETSETTRPSRAGGEDAAVQDAVVNASASHVEEEQQGGTERRGAVRRPPDQRGPSDARGATNDRAVPRSDVPPTGDRVFVYPGTYRNYYRYYDPWGYGGFGLGYFYYSPWAWGPGYYGPGYYAGPGYGGYGYDGGSIKLKVKPRDAEVFVDGYFAGQVDDFDGVFQALKLDSGAYRIEVRKPGFETLQFDVRVQPERSITFRGELKPVP